MFLVYRLPGAHSNISCTNAAFMVSESTRSEAVGMTTRYMKWTILTSCLSIRNVTSTFGCQGKCIMYNRSKKYIFSLLSYFTPLYTIYCIPKFRISNLNENMANLIISLSIHQKQNQLVRMRCSVPRPSEWISTPFQYTAH